MTAHLEARKLSIVEHLAELEDETILRQIENLLKPKVDFWEKLTDKEKASIRQGLDDLDNGKRIAQEFMQKHRRKS